MSETNDEIFRVYYACVGNSARSQMAEALTRALGENVETASGGTDPTGHVLEHVRTAMAEIGVPVLAHESTPIDEAFVANADLVVTMGCGADACPAFHEAELTDWPLEDPDGADLDRVREIRDEIAMRVRTLLDDRGHLDEGSGYARG